MLKKINGCYYERGLIFTIIIICFVLPFMCLLFLFFFFFPECDVDCVAWSDDSLFLAIGERFVSFKG